MVLTKRHMGSGNKIAFFQKHSGVIFPQPQCYQGNIVSSVSFCFQDANYAYATRQRILTKIRACEHLQKFCEHKQASTFKLDGTIRNPYFYFNLF